jgi:uncharacterized protein YndB with AHSA1/START domain
MEFVKSGPGADPVVVEGYYAVPPAKVFAAWTDPEIVVKWFGRAPNSLLSADIDLRPDGGWKFLLSADDVAASWFEGRYLEILPGEKLVFSWAHVSAPADGEAERTPDSRVEVNFTPQGSGTFVRLVHSAVRREDARRGIGMGWEASFGAIRDLLAATPGS